MGTFSSVGRYALRTLGLVALLAPSSLAAQGPAGPLWDSYHRAAEHVRRALDAHGGAAPIRDLAAVSFRWEGEDYAPTQGRVPTAAWDTAGNGRTTVQSIRADLARGRYVFDREFHFPGGYLNAFRLAGRGPELFVYNHHPERGMGGRVYQHDTAGAAARRGLSALGSNMPVLLLRAAQTRAGTLRYLGEASEGGRHEHAVAFTTADGDVVTLYIDADTHLLSRREEVGAGSLGDEVNTYRFDDYRRVGGFMVPHRLEVRWNGILTGRHRLTAFAAAAELPDSLFQIPDGYTLQPAAGALRAVRVAEGVYFLEGIGGGYRMLAVDTDEGLVVVDAPLSPAVSETAIALLERTFPGRPLRYVVITHHHSDHIGGMPAFAARGATFLAAPGSEDYLRRMSTVTRTFAQLAGAPSGPAREAPRIETLRGRRTIGSGARAVQVIDVGPTSHASAMLVVYVPSQRLLFQGDLLRINEDGGPVVALEAARDLERIIRRFRLDVHTIGAVHGLNGTLDDLRSALRRQ